MFALPANRAAILVVAPNWKNAGARGCSVTEANVLRISFDFPGFAITCTLTGPVVVVEAACTLI